MGSRALLLQPFRDHVNVTEVHNVYNHHHQSQRNRVSYNGGDGGIRERPSPGRRIVPRERHIAPFPRNTQHTQEARGNRELRASVNQGSLQSPQAKARIISRLCCVPAREAGDATSRQPIGAVITMLLVPITIPIVRPTGR